jgi:Restriction endonuclease
MLIEAKDYDKPVGLAIVRDFSAVVADLGPDDAYIVTTERFTRDAIRFARAKNIKLAVLRPLRDEDWENLVQRVQLTNSITAMTGPPSVTWQLHPEDAGKISNAQAGRGLMQTDEIELCRENGQPEAFRPILEKQLREESASVPLGGRGVVGRTSRLDSPTWLCAPGLPRLRVVAWKWQADWSTSDPHEIVVGEGVAGLAAELVLKTVGSLHRVFTNREIQSWTFDGKTVAPRSN